MISEQTRKEIEEAVKKMSRNSPIIILEPGMVYTQMSISDCRYKRVAITPELFLHRLIEGTSNVRIVKGLPSGCVVKSHTYDHVSGTWQFIVWHSSFDVVPIGEPIPLIDIHMQAECDKRDDTMMTDECHMYNVLK